MRRERARIARELHDIVAHHIAVIVVQAGAGRLAGAGERHARLPSVLRASASRATRRSPRCRGWWTSSTPTAAPPRRRRPPPRAGGGREDSRPRRRRRRRRIELPAEVEDDALRIVQEGLTNAMKHAPGARVHVRLGLTDDCARGRGPRPRRRPSLRPRPDRRGAGAHGMRERIESLGGSLDAGPSRRGRLAGPRTAPGRRSPARLRAVAGHGTYPSGMRRDSPRGATTPGTAPVHCD